MFACSRGLWWISNDHDRCSVELLPERVGVVEISICRTVVEAVNPDGRNGIWGRCHGCAVVENDGVREGL